MWFALRPTSPQCIDSWPQCMLVCMVSVNYMPPACGNRYHVCVCHTCSWNFTSAPGWTDTETQVLRLCLMVHGVGSWQAILRTGLLPGKTVQQLSGATQRLMGQQALAGGHLASHPLLAVASCRTPCWAVCCTLRKQQRVLWAAVTWLL